jgi:hypothetical protein
VIDYSIGATSRPRTRESIRLQVTVPANADTHDCCPIREHRFTNHPATNSDYAEPERVSSAARLPPCVAAVIAVRNIL